MKLFILLKIHHARAHTHTHTTTTCILMTCVTTEQSVITIELLHLFSTFAIAYSPITHQIRANSTVYSMPHSYNARMHVHIQNI